MENVLYLPALPFKGIDSFRYADRNIFSERDEETEQVFSMVQIFKGCLLFGQSGVGKSSLISAGLIPKFEKNYQAEIIRFFPTQDSAVIVSRILRSRKPDTFLPSLFTSKNSTELKIGMSLNAFKKVIFQQRKPIAEKERIGDVVVSQSKPLILIFDQFEELITLFEETAQKNSKESLSFKDRLQLQTEIISFIQDCYYDLTLNVKLLFVFREDYLAKFSKLFEAIPDLMDHFFRILPVGKEKIENIIQFPFLQDKGNTVYVNSFAPMFVQLLSDKLRNHFAEDNVVLTDLQIVCLFLYQKNTDERQKLLAMTEPVKKILETFYLDILNSFTEQERYTAVSVLSLLVLNERTRNIIHHDAVIEGYLNQITEGIQKNDVLQKSICEKVLLNLENETRIIRKETRKGGDYYEIRSESIIPYINQQKLIREKELEYKKERQQRKKYLWYGLVGVLILFSGIAFYIKNQANRNNDIASLALFFRANQALANDNFLEAYQIYKNLDNDGSTFIRPQVEKVNLGDFDISAKKLFIMQNNYVIAESNDSVLQVWNIKSKNSISLCHEYKNVSKFSISNDNDYFAAVVNDTIILFNGVESKTDTLYGKQISEKIDIHFSLYQNYLSYYSNGLLVIINAENRDTRFYKVAANQSSVLENIIDVDDHNHVYSYNLGAVYKFDVKNDSLVMATNLFLSSPLLYKIGDTLVTLDNYQLRGIDLVTGKTTLIGKISFTSVRKLNGDTLFLCDKPFIYGKLTGYENISLLDFSSGKFIYEFSAGEKSTFPLLALTHDHMVNVLKDTKGNFLLLNILSHTQVKLDSLKNATAFDIADNGQFIIFVKEYKLVGFDAKAVLYEYNIKEDKIKEIDSITPELQPNYNLDIYGQYFFRINSSSDMVAYKKQINDTVFFVVKNLSSGEILCKSPNVNDYFDNLNQKINFTDKYIYVEGNRLQQGIILLNGHQRKNVNYFKSIGLPEMKNVEWIKHRTEALNGVFSSN